MKHIVSLLLLFFVARLGSTASSEGGGMAAWKGHKTAAEETGDVQYGTAFRISDFLRVSSTSDRGRVIRSMLMSYRLFRDHTRTRRDLHATIIVDAPLPGRAIEGVLRDLRSIDVQFTLHYPDIPDTTPLYHYAMRSMLKTDATSFIYIKPEALFLTDPGLQVLESMSEREIACLPYIDANKMRIIVNDESMWDLWGDAEGSKIESASKHQWCSSGLMFFKSRFALSELTAALDVSIRKITSSRIYLDIREESGATSASPLSATDVGDGVLNAVLISSRSISMLFLHHCEGIALVCQSCLRNTIKSEAAVNICAYEASLDILLFPETTVSYLPESENGLLQNMVFPSNKFIFTDLSPSIVSPVVYRVGSETCDAIFSALEHPLRGRNPTHLEWIAAHINARLKRSEFSCQLLSGFVTAVPNGDFLEYGSNAASARAEIWNIGISNQSQYASVSAEVDSDRNGQKFIMPRSVHIISSNMAHLSSQLDEYLAKYEAIPAVHRFMDTSSVVVPCALYAEFVGVSARERRNESMCKLFDTFRGRIYSLGYIPSVLRCDDALQAILLIGPHCAKRNFQRISHLFRNEVAETIRNIVREPYATGRFDSSSGSSLVAYAESGDPIGSLVADEPGHEFKLFEKPLDDRFVDLLVGRLLHRSSMQPPGANSFFIPFNNSKPRSLIEALILEQIAPIVVGDQVKFMYHLYLCDHILSPTSFVA
jgi:hypothetical protein